MTSVLPSQQIFAQHGIDPATLRWTGQPCSGLLFRRSDVYFIPISVIFFSIGVFAESTAIMSRDPIGRGFAAVFVVIGAYLLFGRFIWDAYARSKTYYGLTSDSAIIVRAGSSSAQRIYLPAVQQLGFTLSANGSGTDLVRRFGALALLVSERLRELGGWSTGSLIRRHPGCAPRLRPLRERAACHKLMSATTRSEELFAQSGIAASELRWSGRPCTGVLFRRGDTLNIVAGSWIVGGTGFMEWGILHASGPQPGLLLFQLLFTLVFLFVFYLGFGRFIWDAYRRSVTYYGLTADTAIILRQGIGAGIQRLYLPSIDVIGFELWRDGRGTISFGGPTPATFWSAYGSARTVASGPPFPSFEGVHDAQHVYDLCVGAQHAGRDVT